MQTSTGLMTSVISLMTHRQLNIIAEQQKVNMQGNLCFF